MTGYGLAVAPFSYLPLDDRMTVAEFFSTISFVLCIVLHFEAILSICQAYFCSDSIAGLNPGDGAGQFLKHRVVDEL